MIGDQSGWRCFVFANVAENLPLQNEAPPQPGKERGIASADSSLRPT